ITGGDAFCRTLLQQRVSPDFFRSFEQAADPLSTIAAWHGCGRALWFCWTGDSEMLTSVLQSYAPASTALSLGLGMAITFTQIASPDRGLRSIDGFPTSLHDLLMQACAVTVAILIEENPLERDRLHALYAGALGGCLDDVMHAVKETHGRAEASTPRWYGD